MAGMGSVLSALAFLLMIFAGWENRHQLIVIEYLKGKNRMLRERLRPAAKGLTCALKVMCRQ